MEIITLRELEPHNNLDEVLMKNEMRIRGLAQELYLDGDARGESQAFDLIEIKKASEEDFRAKFVVRELTDQENIGYFVNCQGPTPFEAIMNGLRDLK